MDKVTKERQRPVREPAVHSARPARGPEAVRLMQHVGNQSFQRLRAGLLQAQLSSEDTRAPARAALNPAGTAEHIQREAAATGGQRNVAARADAIVQELGPMIMSDQAILDNLRGPDLEAVLRRIDGVSAAGFTYLAWMLKRVDGREKRALVDLRAAIRPKILPRALPGICAIRGRRAALWTGVSRGPPTSGTISSGTTRRVPLLGAEASRCCNQSRSTGEPSND